MGHFVLKINWDILHPTALQRINKDLKKYEEVVRILLGFFSKMYASRWRIGNEIFQVIHGKYKYRKENRKYK